MVSFLENLFIGGLLIAILYVGFFNKEERPLKDQWQVMHPLKFQVRLPDGKSVMIWSHQIEAKYRYRGG